MQKVGNEGVIAAAPRMGARVATAFPAKAARTLPALARDALKLLG